MIFVGSAYFGYHYWIDGIVAAGVAGVSWKCSTAYFARHESQAAAMTEATNIA